MLKRMKWLCGAVLAISLVLMFVPVMATTTWQQTGGGLGVIKALAIDPVNNLTIYAGGVNGVFKSINGGDIWESANNGINYVAPGGVICLVIDQTNTQTIYAGTYSGVFKSIDGGGSWLAASSGIVDFDRIVVQSLAIDPNNNNILYAGLLNDEYSRGGVFKSTNGGITWTATALSNSNVLTLAIDPNNSQIIYSGGGVDHCDLFKSTDGGSTWTALSSGLNIASTQRNGVVNSLAFDPSNSLTIYAGLSDSNINCGGVYKSTDGGYTWSAENNGLINSFGNLQDVRSLAIGTDTKTIYTGTYYGGAFTSADGGTSWNAVNNGLTNLTIHTLVIDPTNHQTIYVGTDGGVFKSLDYQPPKFPIAQNPTFSVGTAGTYTVAVTGTPSPALSLSSGTLPNGLTFSNGVISGTPSIGTAGSYPITITASNGVPPDAIQNFILIVSSPTPPPPPNPGTPVPVMDGWWLFPGMLVGMGLFARRRKG